MTGVAQAADSIDDLASFLGGEPDEAHEGEEDDEEVDATDEEAEEGEDQEESEDDESEPEPTQKFKVSVKNEDGTEAVEEIDQTELIAGYQRQKAFTQKTMELAARERQATEIVQQRVTEASQYAMQQAQMAKAIVSQLAGTRSAEELRELSYSDPASWAQEKQRAEDIGNLTAQLDAAIAADKQRIEAIEHEQEKAQSAAAWEVLAAKGIDKAKLSDVYSKAMSAYGVQPATLGKILDAGIALALKDALLYRELLAKKPQVANKVKEAERLPTTKKSLPTNERNNRALGEKFSKGRAKVNDLAAFLANNKF